MGTSGKRFLIAFSFAGEKRDFVAKVADILAKRFGEAVILYDKYHLAEFSRSDLAFKLWRTVSVAHPHVANALNDLADTERLSGDLAAAEQHYREALQVVRAVEDAEGEAVITSNLAELALDQTDWSHAEALAREALSLSERVGRRELIAGGCHLVARALVEQRKRAEGLPFAQRAVGLFTDLDSPHLEVAIATLRKCESTVDLD